MDPLKIEEKTSPVSDIDYQTSAVRTSDVGLTGNVVKMIAIVSMLIDHIGYAVVYPYLFKIASTGNKTAYDFTRILYDVMRGIGRLAFPLFCFFLVEGFFHTRSRAKYGLRLLAFAFISEVPFDLAFYHRYTVNTHNNVFWTLFLGLMALWLIDIVKERIQDKSIVISVILYLAILGAACVIAAYIKCDYTYSGILSIAAFYFFRKDRQWATTISTTALVLLSSALEAVAFLNLPILMHYNGKRGSSAWKYFFYAFYPLHLILLALLARAAGLVVWS